MKFHDLTGQVFDRLTVLTRAEKLLTPVLKEYL